MPGAPATACRCRAEDGASAADEQREGGQENGTTGQHGSNLAPGIGLRRRGAPVTLGPA